MSRIGTQSGLGSLSLLLLLLLIQTGFASGGPSLTHGYVLGSWTTQLAESAAWETASNKPLVLRVSAEDPSRPAESTAVDGGNAGNVIRFAQPRPLQRRIIDVVPGGVNTGQQESNAASSEPSMAHVADGDEEEPETRPELSPETQRLLASMGQTLEFYRQQKESVHRRSPWGIMHAMIAFEAETEVIAGRKSANALGYLCWNGICANNRLLYSRNGVLGVKEGPGLQGHQGQFLAMLAQCGVLPENELRVGSESFSVVDLIEFEQQTCRPNTELTFKLLALSYYLDSDATWNANDGRAWSIPELIREELKQPVIGAACGGTHRLMGLTYAVRYRALDGKPIDGQWHRAAQFLSEFRDYTYSLQNPDGSFSTNWFEGREARPDLQRRVQTTGHILEWLVVLADDEELTDPRLLRAAAYLNQVLAQNRRVRWEIGPKGHAIHALVLFQKRLSEAYQTRIAEQPQTTSSAR